MDITICVYVEGKYDFISSFENGLAVVQNNRKYGYISTDGKLSVGLNYDDAKPFSEGYGAVCQKGKWGFIDTNGEMKIPLQYEAAMPFSEEMASVKLDGKWGFIDKTGNAVILCIYDNACCFSEGLAPVRYKGVLGYIDKSGKTSIQITGNYVDLSNFYEGMARVCVTKNNNESLFGMINKNGEAVIEPKYKSMNSFREGLVSAEGMTCDEKFFLDKIGREIIKLPAYAILSDFREGLAAVCTGVNHDVPFPEKEKDIIHRIAAINTVNMEPDAKNEMNELLSELNCLSNEHADKRYADSKWGFISKEGETVILPEYEYISWNGYGFFDGKSKMKTGGKMGYINHAGQIIYPAVFDFAGDFHDGYAVAKKDGKYIVLYSNQDKTIY